MDGLYRWLRAVVIYSFVVLSIVISPLFVQTISADQHQLTSVIKAQANVSFGNLLPDGFRLLGDRHRRINAVKKNPASRPAPVTHTPKPVATKAQLANARRINQVFFADRQKEQQLTSRSGQPSGRPSGRFNGHRVQRSWGVQ